MSELPVIKPEWLVGITLTQAQKDQWLQALRGGQYHQGEGGLFSHGGYCCLGVFAKECLGIERPRGYYLYPYSRALTPSFTGASEIEEMLAEMNDTGKSFAEIADFIEKNIPACDAVKP